MLHKLTGGVGDFWTVTVIPPPHPLLSSVVQLNWSFPFVLKSRPHVALSSCWLPLSIHVVFLLKVVPKVIRVQMSLTTMAEPPD